MLEIATVSKKHFVHSLHTPGAFAWWYVDMTDEQGNGLVLVWALGLPFLPESRSLSLPSKRPALHLATYRAGLPELYLLQEYDAAEASFSTPDGSGRLGGSTFESIQKDGQLALRIQLSLEIPASHERLTCAIEVNGPSVLLDSTEQSLHAWTPRSLHANGRAELKYAGDTQRLNGAAYFDSNLSHAPLHDQGILSWRWGRINFGDETLVYYDVSMHDQPGQSLILVQSATGPLQKHNISPRFSSDRSGNFGVSSPRQVNVEVNGNEYEITLDSLVDDGPFYQRFIASGVRTRPGRTHGTSERTIGRGVTEIVLPNRIDLRWQRPFVKMKTQRIGPHATNSCWLPLFSGYQADRTERLARGLIPGAPA